MSEIKRVTRIGSAAATHTDWKEREARRWNGQVDTAGMADTDNVANCEPVTLSRCPHCGKAYAA